MKFFILALLNNKKGNIMEESTQYIDLVWKVLNNWWIKFAEFTPNLVVGLVVFSLFIYTSRFLSRITVNLVQKLFPKAENQDSVVTLISFFRFLIILAGTFISLEIMGISGFFIKFIGSLGVAGIIAGVALKDIVSSMFSGMLVSIDKAFKVGDSVQIGNITGKVVDIGFLTTKLFTDDGKKYYIPNQQIFNAPFINFSESLSRKLILDLEIPNTINLNNLNKILIDELKKNFNIENSEDINIIYTNQKLGYYELQISFDLKAGSNVAKSKSDVLFTIKNRLDEEGIDTSLPNKIRY